MALWNEMPRSLELIKSNAAALVNQLILHFPLFLFLKFTDVGGLM
jgi:hypothetical protein